MADEPKKPSAGRRAARMVLNTALTLSVVGAAGFAVVFGSEMLANRAEASVSANTAERLPVTVTELTLSDGYTLPRQFVGQVEAAATVALSFELGGRLSELLVEEGAQVDEGQLLARLDTALLLAERSRLDAARAATTAQLELAESRLVRALALREDGFASEEAVDQTRATRDELQNRIRETDALIASVAINLEKSELFAPFAGQVGLRNVDGGETLSAGAPVLTLIETATPQVRVGLPLSVDLNDLDNAEIAVNGATYPARLLHVRPDIDPVTRTRTAIFAIEAPNAPTFGQTATLILEDRVALPGTWLPLDALQEGVGGVWTVLVVDEGVVRSAMVEVLYADAARAYVRGTFQPGTQMIDAGAHRVVPGQQVRVLAEAE
ncbi:efflux RND transporter periplasmic adaptor subunit [Cognatishimia sp. MH4019]|uniref:efflux RND transporter periplasmic adaptor subunit n=1 Tax=Cognatishimia sp. MH4019 TaxID=2854030 RepID=UPI001CD779E4|nr:efflux RND transporter periplasmic adaptor subunit [Cognatishimia sp. MH4019]